MSWTRIGMYGQYLKGSFDNLMTKFKWFVETKGDLPCNQTIFFLNYPIVKLSFTKTNK